MSAWAIVLIAGLGSYALRISMVSTDRIRLPARLEESAELVAPAAFTALAVSGLTTAVLADRTFGGVTPIMLAVAAAALATARSGRPLAAMLAGAPTYWLAAALIPGS